MESSEHILKFLLQSTLFSSCMAMRILFNMFSFVILLFKALKYEAVNFSISPLAHANGRQKIQLWHAIKS